MEPRGVERRLRQRVVLVCHNRHTGDSSQPTTDRALEALRIDPPRRTQTDIDSIFSTVGKWPDFQKFIHTEQERRELCRRMTCEDWHRMEIVVKQGDETDGLYLIFTGQCSVYSIAATRDDGSQNQIPSATLAVLRSALGSDKCFVQVAVKGPTEEFGAASLIGDEPWNGTIVTDKPTVLLRIDPPSYHETLGWFARSVCERKAALLLQVRELQVLRKSRELVLHLAATMEQVRMRVGTEIGNDFFPRENTMSFIVVEEGVFVKRRAVNFSGTKVASDSTIALPIGVKTVKVGQFGPREMIPVPAMRICVPFPFTLYVAEEVTGYLLKLVELASMLLNVQTQKIIRMFASNEPNDEKVIRMWIEKQEAVQWQAYRKKCVKEARRILKAQRAISMGEWAIRKAGPPKAIKEHRPFTTLRPKQYDAIRYGHSPATSSPRIHNGISSHNEGNM
jgi:CRP-like cAMP-binding protein